MPSDPSVDAARWARAQQLFHAALEHPEHARTSFVQRASAGDAALVDQVQRMLAADARADSILDRGVRSAAVELLSPPSLPPEGLFGPYRLLHPIGEGGMATVYLAERDDLGSQVAVKVLHHAWLSPARRDRFSAEQRTLARLNHPGIARLHDAGTLGDGTPWIAMEYVDGLTLTVWCRTHATDLAARFRLFRDVCEAVQHAHGHLVVHRDLKPSNILVAADGRVKLLDFGIAKQLEPTGTDLEATRTGLRLLTPAYAAPEQLLGEVTGVHTDVYALGVLLYELLTGVLPFDPAERGGGRPDASRLERAPERPSVRARRAAPTDDPLRPVQASAAEWAELDVLCLTALQRDPSRRYRTVEALRRDLDHFLRQEPLLARPDSARYRAATFVRRHRRALGVGSAAVAMMVVLASVSALRVRNARDAAIVDAERAQRIQQFTVRLFEAGEELGTSADSLRAVRLVERGVVEAAGLSGTPLVQGEMYQTLGAIFQRLGQLERADSLLQRSLEARRTVSAEHPEVARSLVALGLLRVEQARLPEAEIVVREGLRLSTRMRRRGHLDIAVATSALGRVLEERGAYEEAIVVMREAVRMHEAIAPASAELVAATTQLGNDYFYSGDYEAASAQFQRSLEVARQVYGASHPLVADALINLGAVHYQRGEYARAEAYDRDGLLIFERAFGTDDPRTASAMTMLGRALVAQSAFDEAVPLVERALGIRERVYGVQSPRVASSINELGIMALQRERYDEADAYFARNVSIYRAVYGGPHNLLGTALANRGSVMAARGDHAGAERLYREALAVFTAVLPETHLDIGIARIKLGRALLRQGAHEAAVTESAAGLTVVLAQTGPRSGWVRNARRDLASAYEELGRTSEAAAMRGALADTTGG
jgi:eukaryotic-like serine/threonine-protein kinase